MDRSFLYDEFVHCDICEQLGAYNVYGDYICQDCLRATHEGMEVA